MAKTAQQVKFGRVAKQARSSCIASSSSASAFDRCMSSAMKDGMAKKRKSKRSGRKATPSCAGIAKSGPKKGKLKKGYRYKKGSICPVKV